MDRAEGGDARARLPIARASSRTVSRLFHGASCVAANYSRVRCFSIRLAGRPRDRTEAARAVLLKREARNIFITRDPKITQRVRLFECEGFGAHVNQQRQETHTGVSP
jgi:hypothetical protein